MKRGAELGYLSISCNETAKLLGKAGSTDPLGKKEGGTTAAAATTEQAMQSRALPKTVNSPKTTVMCTKIAARNTDYRAKRTPHPQSERDWVITKRRLHLLRSIASVMQQLCPLSFHIGTPSKPHQHASRFYQAPTVNQQESKLVYLRSSVKQKSQNSLAKPGVQVRRKKESPRKPPGSSIIALLRGLQTKDLPGRNP